MDPNTTSAVRDIFVIVAAGAFSALCVTVIVLAAKLYRPLRDSAQNAATTTENLSKASGHLAAISEETAANVAQTSRNAVVITENLKEGSEELTGTVQTAREAADKISAVAGTVGTIADTVSGLSSMGVSGGGSSSSGVGSLLRLFRTIVGGSRRADGGAQQGP